MDKTTSVIAAFDAGKLPSTAQINSFIDWVDDVALDQVSTSLREGTPSAQSLGAGDTAERVQQELSTQGRILSTDIKRLLEAYKFLVSQKNGDNILQEAYCHLTSADLTLTPEARNDKEQALADFEALRNSLRTLLSSLWTSLSSESSSLMSDFLSFLRISLADTAEVIESHAGLAKDSLRDVEEGVQKGERDSLGRDKERLRQEKEGGAEVKWEHGMDTVKDAGKTVISNTRAVSESLADKKERTTSRVQDAWFKITDRAQRDPQYREAIDTIFSIIQKRLQQGLDLASDPNTSTLSQFVQDPTPEQHLPKALHLIQTFIERLANTSLEPLTQEIRTCSRSILQDDQLKSWFDDFLTEARKNLSEPGYARSDEATASRKQLNKRWKELLDKDEKWKANVDSVKREFNKISTGMQNDAALNKIKDAQAQLGNDLEKGLSDVGQEAATGVQAAVEQATWFWQDLFKVWVPRILNKMKDVPIPRTEYKDEEIEFVLENLDISSFNILPSHVYIRNITDIDIDTSASSSVPSRTAVGTLTHIRIQALQMQLKDVSFWYKDKTASAVTPSEFTGLLNLALPPKGIDVDIKVRLIPASVTGPRSRGNLRHFNVVERAVVSFSDDVDISVRESNHSVLMTLFKPVMMLRLKEALEKTLSEQVRGLIDWADGVAWDVGCRKEVFEDTGLGGGGSLVAAIWSEFGRMQRESRQDIGWRATGTGIIVEQHAQVGGKDTYGELGGRQGGREKTSAFAMGAEPQILSGDKRGPLGTGSEPLEDKLERIGDEVGIDTNMDVDAVPGRVADGVKQVVGEAQNRAAGMAKEGKRQWDGFKRTVERKKVQEEEREGWKSSAFDL